MKSLLQEFWFRGGWLLLMITVIPPCLLLINSLSSIANAERLIYNKWPTSHLYNMMWGLSGDDLRL